MMPVNFEMGDQIQSDDFYANFPGFGNQEEHKQHLADDRKHEYKQYLLEKAAKEQGVHDRQTAANTKYHSDIAHREDNRLFVDNFASNKNGGSSAPMTPRAREELLHNLRHTDLPGHSSNPDAVHTRNQEDADLATRKKMDYQRDLMKQIEDKKIELKAIKERDRLEEEKLTKRLQEQLRAMQLEDELQKEKARTEQVRHESEQNHIRRMHLLTQMENDHKLYNRYNENMERKTQSESGNPMLSETSEKVYKYFSNSAAAGGKSTSQYRRTHFMETSDSSIEHSPPPVPPQRPPAPDAQKLASEISIYCKRCLGNIDDEPPSVVCQFCERKRLHLPINEPFCLKCHIALTTPESRSTGLCRSCAAASTRLRCGFCQKTIDICPRCNAVFCSTCHQLRQQQENNENIRPNGGIMKRIIEVDRPIVAAPTIMTSRSKPLPPKVVAKTKSKVSPIVYRSFNVFADDLSAEHDDDDGDASVGVRRTDRLPYSMNVERTSMFHPNRTIPPAVAQPIMLRSDVNDRVARYARNYGELRGRRSMETEKGHFDDSCPVPLMPMKSATNLSPRKQPERTSHAVMQLQRKWEIPAVQKNLLTNDNTNGQQPNAHRVLTQLGAIRKQLQLEKMEMDQTILNHRH